MKHHMIGVVLIVATVMVASVLSFYGTTDAASPKQNVPAFANPAGNRLEMIQELKQIVSEMKKQNELLTEQNDLLKSGKLQVVVTIDEQTAGR
ncbi:MAG: hypothetical protein JW888_17680 [Pirellulales bacterium]|nr:hypothetical protein [Pirellulales bacterium]